MQAFDVTCHLLDAEKINTLQITSEALALNLYLEKTQGASVALDEPSDSLVLHYQHNMNSTDYQGFENIVNNLISISKTFKDVLDDADKTLIFDAVSPQSHLHTMVHA